MRGRLRDWTKMTEEEQDRELAEIEASIAQLELEAKMAHLQIEDAAPRGRRMSGHVRKLAREFAKGRAPVGRAQGSGRRTAGQKRRHGSNPGHKASVGDGSANARPAGPRTKETAQHRARAAAGRKSQNQTYHEQHHRYGKVSIVKRTANISTAPAISR